MENGEPVDKDDCISKEHNLVYSRTCSHEDVSAADRAPTLAFFKNFIGTGQLESCVGSASPGSKNLLKESSLGRSLYGMSSGRWKRPAEGAENIDVHFIKRPYSEAM